MTKKKTKIALFHCGFVYSGGGDPVEPYRSPSGTIRTRLTERLDGVN